MSAPVIASASVEGLGFFSPVYRSAGAARRDERSAVREAEFAIVQGRLRRFTSPGTQRLLEAAGQALATATGSPSEVRTVFGTAYGELETTIDILSWIETGQGVSAPRFVQSVHSTASGLLSIATRNHRPATTVAAGDATVGAALLEAALQILDRPGPVLVVVGEEPIPAELGAGRVYEPCACAFVLGPPAATGPLLELRRGAPASASSDDFPAFATSPVLPGLRLAAALEAGERATLGAGALFGRDELTVELSFR